MTQRQPQIESAIPPLDVPLVDTAGRLTEAWRVYFERQYLRSGGPFDQGYFTGASLAMAERVLQAHEARLGALEAQYKPEDPDRAIAGLRAEIEALRAQLAGVTSAGDLNQIRAEFADLRRDTITQIEAASRRGFPGGNLAFKDSVGDTEIRDGFQLVSSVSSAPSASSTRIVQDSSDGGVYADDGTNIVRLSPVFAEARLGSNTDFSSTSFQVVAQAELGARLASALIWVAEVFDAFQAPDEASDATYEGQWVLYLSDTPKSVGDDPFGLGTEELSALFTGSVGGLTFTTTTSIQVASNDLGQDIYPTPKKLGNTYAGAPAYLQLCLKRTAGAGAAKLSSAFGFDAFAVNG